MILEPFARSVLTIIQSGEDKTRAIVTPRSTFLEQLI